MRRNILTLLIAMTAALAFSACSSGTLYEEIQTIKGEKWNKEKGLAFEFEITDSLQEYTIYMNIRNSVEYQYQNLFLFMDSKDPQGELHRDTLEFVLADAYGNWKGKGGRLKDQQYFFYPRVRFPRCGKYTFTFYQAMREDNLEGIANFGITIRKFDEQKFKKEMQKRQKEQDN